jgi:hypothetical protein
MNEYLKLKYTLTSLIIDLDGKIKKNLKQSLKLKISKFQE